MRFEHSCHRALEDCGFILKAELRSIVPLHPAHITKLVRRQEFPAPVKLGRRTAFVRREVLEWCQQQAARRP
jgi:predicted DNA-binding transcriptional regulator AlpA